MLALLKMVRNALAGKDDAPGAMVNLYEGRYSLAENGELSASEIASLRALLDGWSQPYDPFADGNQTGMHFG